MASVSSFGVGGTNAHVVLKAAAQLLGLGKLMFEHSGIVFEQLIFKPRNGHGTPEKVTWNRKPMEALGSMDRCFSPFLGCDSSNVFLPRFCLQHFT